MQINPMEYLSLYRSSQVHPERKTEILARVAQIITNHDKYSEVEAQTGIPWYYVSCIHSLESSCNFACHLHNGDPLSARTVHIPRGRPVEAPWGGELPYPWAQSAIDALESRWRPSQWDLAGGMEFLERYNGLGYRVYKVNSPYLWAATDAYTSGLFVFDGKFSPLAVSYNLGAVALLKALQEQGMAGFTV